ncbi:MAG: cobalt-precorrin-6A reductase [Alphaproteobacteria bacterium]|nr:cobalt-precorrin-6A reductase [Alphaproteobacteria bacterium]
MKKILILGGTAEAVSLAAQLKDYPGISVIYSLAGRTRSPNLPDCAVRQGGFGGTDGLTRYLMENDIAAVIDATHPYAGQMAENARRATSKLSLAHYKYLRTPWSEPCEAPWIWAASSNDAAEKIRGKFNRVFLSGGLNDVAAFTALNDVWFLIRSIEYPSTPIPIQNFSHIKARGPFDVVGERKLMQENKIDALVSKNSGGSATEAKLHAAQALSIPIIMIDRPPPLGGVVFDDQAMLIDRLRQDF